jgi:hypothetical protein
MTEQSENRPSGEVKATETDPARNNQENELEAEEESAAAMNADVPQPPAADETTEGQPS